MSTPHNEAEKQDIAPTLLMPGDPLRAKFIAEHYLQDVKQFNKVRNMFGYTGTYQGKRISVMGSGMGMASIGIYSYELYKFYNVENIIRIGSAGAYTNKLNLFDLVLANAAWSESSYALAQAGVKADMQLGDETLNALIVQQAKKLAMPLMQACIHSSDVFYHEDNVDGYEAFYTQHNCVCVEMESFALFHNAHILGKRAACLLTISDSLVKDSATSSKEREQSFSNMITLALESAIQL